MIRPDPALQYPDMPQLTADLTAFLSSDPIQLRLAHEFCVRSSLLPTGEDIVVLALGSHLLPSTTTSAIRSVLRETGAPTIILSGGRTHEEWPLDKTEAGLLHASLTTRGFNDHSRILLEDRATNTAENFVKTAEIHGDVLRDSGHIVIVTHDAHTARALMTARAAFVKAGIRDLATFEASVHVHGYNPLEERLSPNSPRILAGELARMTMYDEGGDILATAADRRYLQQSCTLASEYASTTIHDRRKYQAA